MSESSKKMMVTALPLLSKSMTMKSSSLTTVHSQTNTKQMKEVTATIPKKSKYTKGKIKYKDTIELLKQNKPTVLDLTNKYLPSELRKRLYFEYQRHKKQVWWDNLCKLLNENKDLPCKQEDNVRQQPVWDNIIVTNDLLSGRVHSADYRVHERCALIKLVYLWNSYIYGQSIDYEFKHTIQKLLYEYNTINPAYNLIMDNDDLYFYTIRMYVNGIHVHVDYKKFHDANWILL